MNIFFKNFVTLVLLPIGQPLPILLENMFLIDNEMINITNKCVLFEFLSIPFVDSATSWQNWFWRTEKWRRPQKSNELIKVVKVQSDCQRLQASNCCFCKYHKCFLSWIASYKPINLFCHWCYHIQCNKHVKITLNESKKDPYVVIPEDINNCCLGM